jgi:hypothetical protein
MYFGSLFKDMNHLIQQIQLSCDKIIPSPSSGGVGTYGGLKSRMSTLWCNPASRHLTRSVLMISTNTLRRREEKQDYFGIKSESESELESELDLVVM